MVATLMPGEGVPVADRMWNEKGSVRHLVGLFSVLRPLIVRTGSRCRWRRCGCFGRRLAGVVLRGGRRRWGAGGRLVLWLGPKEPHCLAGVSGGRDGSPAAVPERWSVARACGGAPEPRLRERPSCGQCVAGAGGRGRWFGAGGRGPGRWWPMVRGVRRGSRAVTAAGLVRLRT